MPDSTTVRTKPAFHRAQVSLFIALWIAVQVIIPFTQKFELPSLRYRYGRFSWAIFSRLVPVYEARLFRVNRAGQQEAIPDIDRCVAGYRSPEPMRRDAMYVTPQEVQDRLTRLVTYIARERRDGYEYVASVRWIKHRGPEVSEQWEFRTLAAP